MTEERLEELIKQEAEIYVVAYNNIFKYKLEKKLRPFIGCNRLWVDVFNIPYDYQFNQIFETEADAEKEFERQMWKEKTTAERIERFEPPMWEDIDKEYVFNFIKDLERVHFGVSKIVNSLCPEGFICVRSDEILFAEFATKENYEKACEIVRDLFKGEK